MEKENLRVTDLSLLMGVTRKTIYEWLRGKGPLHPNHVRAQLIQKMNEGKGRDAKLEDMPKRGESLIFSDQLIPSAVSERLAHLPTGYRERFQGRLKETTRRVQRELEEFLELLEAEYRLEGRKRRKKKA